MPRTPVPPETAGINRIDELLRLSKGIALDRGKTRIELEDCRDALGCYKLDGRPVVIREIEKRHAASPAASAGPRTEEDFLRALRRGREAAETVEVSPEVKDVVRLIRLHHVGMTRRFRGGGPFPPALETADRVGRILSRDIVGQEKAVAAMAHSFALPRKQGGPASFFVAVGPAASGMGLAARGLAEALGCGLLVIDCAGLRHPDAFIGSGTVWSGAQTGELTRHVLDHPHCVVHLENFELMSPEASGWLPGLIADGFLRDRHGFYEDDDSHKSANMAKRQIADPVVDFRQCHLMLSLHAGEELHGEPRLLERLRAEGGEAAVRGALLEALSHVKATTQGAEDRPVFNGALLSAIRSRATCLLFEPLGWDALRRVARRELPPALADFARNLGLEPPTLEPGFLDDCADLLLLAQGGRANAAAVSRDNLSRNLFQTLVGRILDAGEMPGALDFRLSRKDARALARIREELGDDPVRTLFRTLRRLRYDARVAPRAGGMTLFLEAPRLVRITDALDFRDNGGGRLLVEAPATRFADVAGLDRAKRLLADRIAEVRNWARLKEQGVRPPGGALLHGEPGTGKTLLARALAGEAELPFVASAAPGLLRLERLEEVFAILKKSAPAVWFIDEIDVLGRRGGPYDPVINTLLHKLDGFSSLDEAPVYVVAATNFPDKVDPALLRPGRLETVIEIPAPDREARRVLLARVASRLSPETLEAALDYTTHMSAAAMHAVVRGLVSSPGDRGPISEERVRAVVQEQRYGEAINVPDRLRDLIAHHESGHAVVALRGLGDESEVRYISLTARKGDLAHVSREAPRDAPVVLADRPRMLMRMAVFLAGPAAQRRFLGMAPGTPIADAGDRGDLEQANRLARQAVTGGLDEVIGLRVYTEQDQPSPAAAELMEERVRVWLREAEALAERVVAEHWPVVKALAAALLDKGILCRADIAAAAGGVPNPRERDDDNHTHEHEHENENDEHEQGALHG